MDICRDWSLDDIGNYNNGNCICHKKIKELRHKDNIETHLKESFITN